MQSSSMLSSCGRSVASSFLNNTNLNRAGLNGLNRLLLDSSNTNSSNISITGQSTIKRFLFTDEVLGIDRFLEVRKRVGSQFGDHREKFLERLAEHLKEENGVILSEDLKNLVFLCENNESDIKLLKQAIKKFEQQNESLRYGTFNFGPVVMRLMHHFNLPNFTSYLLDKKYINFYSQLSSITIALDLLYKNDRHDDVVRLFDFVIEKYNFDAKYPSDFVTIYLASCYKLNTIESFDRAFRLLRSVKMNENAVKLRALNYFFLLAIKQNHPNIALEVIQQLNMKNYSTLLQSLRLMAFADIHRFHDVLEILRFYLKKDKPASGRVHKLVFQEAIDQIQEKVNKSGKEELINEFSVVLKNLDESDLIEKEKTLESVLLEPIAFVRNRNRNVYQQQQVEEVERANAAI